MQRGTIPLSLLVLSSLIIQTIAYGQSLADCKAVAAHFRNTCEHGDYDTPAANVTNMTSETEYCDDGSHQCFAGATMNDDGYCEWERKLCVTCKEVNGTVKIRLQTNNLPDHCVENKLADALILDYEVNFNQNEIYGEWFQDLKTQEDLDDAVCPIHKSYQTSYFGIIEYGGTESEHAMGFAINGVAFQFANSIEEDPVAPLQEDNEQPLDICLGHNQLNSDSGMYHYHSVSPCINQTFLNGTYMAECAENEQCSSDVVSWMLSGFEGMKSKTIIGLSKFGHVVYGPYDNSEALWDTEHVDACNGAWSDDKDEYFFVTTRWHPYGPGCPGPTNLFEDYQLYPGCSTNGIGQYITDSPTIHPTGNPTTEPTTGEPTINPTTNPTIEPTTPAPTYHAELSCGDHETGEYNGEPIEIHVQMTYDGDMTLNASGSTFDISEIVAYDEDDNILTDSNSHSRSSTLTVFNLTHSGNYNVTVLLTAADGVSSGTFDIVIECTSAEPSTSPTIQPTAGVSVNIAGDSISNTDTENADSSTGASTFWSVMGDQWTMILLILAGLLLVILLLMAFNALQKGKCTLSFCTKSEETVWNIVHSNSRRFSISRRSTEMAPTGQTGGPVV